jgi:hypothetical protein
MGMDLCSDLPGYDQHFNWSGWAQVTDQLQEWGISMDEFSQSNDGDLISDATCQSVAAAIVAHRHEIPPAYWTRDEAVDCWRKCGGFRQW